MPETVEIAFLSQKLNNFFENEYLESFDVLMGRYSKNNIKNIEEFKKDFPLKCIEIQNKSKVIFWKFENGWYMISKLGLMGWWYNLKNDEIFTKKWSNIILNFSNNKRTIYSDHLSFGTLTITKDLKYVENEKNKLGVDIMSNDFTKEYLLDKISKLSKSNKNKLIEDLIMDQKILFSGVGNYLKSEILYASKISPLRIIKDIKNEEWVEFHYHTKRITNMMLKKMNLKNSDEYMNSMQVYMKEFDKNGYKIITHKAKNGRTTHWVQEIQK